MYRPDIYQLREFYSSAIGKLVKEATYKSLRSFWPELRNDILVTLGYCIPFLHKFNIDKNSDEQVIAAMPAAQGAQYWPPNKDGSSLLVHATNLPFNDNHINRMLLIHELENTQNPEELLEEIWRTLTPGGRVIIIVPNRKGLWSSSVKTPFSYGTPYSVTQLRKLLRENKFTCLNYKTYLFFPPAKTKILQKLARTIEYPCSVLLKTMGGLIILEAEKQIYASVKERKKSIRTSNSYIPAIRPAMNKN